jgi:hypothetical protein
MIALASLAARCPACVAGADDRGGGALVIALAAAPLVVALAVAAMIVLVLRGRR